MTNISKQSPPSAEPSAEMKKHDELLYSIVTEICGDEATIVVNFLQPDKEITDDSIGEKTGLKINAIRRILYKLYENHLASYRRVRDKDTGWFIYYWKLNPTQVSNLVQHKRELVLKKLEERLEYEKSRVFYRCDNEDCPRYTFEEAMELSFQCAICQEPLVHYNNQAIIETLERKIQYLVSKI